MHRDTFLGLVLFVIGSVCSEIMVSRSVHMPVGQWKAVKSNTVVDMNTIHRLLFVAQHDAGQVEKLKQMVEDVSDPDSVNYGNFMSSDKVYQSVLTKTTENGHKLEQWAKTKGLKVIRSTQNKQYIEIEASVETVQRVFQTKLQQFEHIKTGKLALRSTSFVLPSDIHNCMAMIDGLSHFPMIRKTKKTRNNAAQVSSNAPIIHRLDSGFGDYLFYVQPVCDNGTSTSESNCESQLSGFRISISGQAKLFSVSAAKANCEVCSKATNLTALFCGTFSLQPEDILCRFYLKKSGSIPLYKPHTFTVQTKFLQGISDGATYASAVEKVIDITPPVLRSLYNVDESANAPRDRRTRQAIAGFQEYLDLSAFRNFAALFGKKFTPVLGKVYGNDYRNRQNDEGETSLDIQYMASMGFRIPMDYISSPPKRDGFLLEFFVQLTRLEEDKKNVVPLIYSISYGLDETDADISYISSCEVQFMLMSVAGKTVFVSSGDDGSTSGDGKCREIFVPSYPGSSAYVTSVGATQFVKSSQGCTRRIDKYCLEEITAAKSLLTGCRITSGGGFSIFVASPNYQREAVQTYLNNPKNQVPPASYFNRSNRAYPDISLAGHQYQLKVYGDADLFLDGTSASSPATAGLISLILDRRFRMGQKAFGLLNPLLYKLAVSDPTVFYDVTKGNTSCSTSRVCCEYGFAASEGWDPATGFGSINHQELTQLLTQTSN